MYSIKVAAYGGSSNVLEIQSKLRTLLPKDSMTTTLTFLPDGELVHIMTNTKGELIADCARFSQGLASHSGVDLQAISLGVVDVCIFCAETNEAFYNGEPVTIKK